MPLVDSPVSSMLQGMTQQSRELRLPTQGELQRNAVSHPVWGLMGRAGTNHIRTLDLASSRPFAAWISRDDNERYLLTYDNASLRLMTLDGRGVFVEADASALDYLSSSAPDLNLRTLSLADSTIILNRSRMVGLRSDIQSDPVPFQALIHVRAANYSQTYTVKIGASTYTITTSPTDASAIRTTSVAAAILTEMGVVGLPAGISVTHLGGGTTGVLHVTEADDNPFDISVSDSIGNTGLVLVTDTVAAFSDLPNAAPAGFKTRVVNGAESEADDYWVEWVVENGNGSWVESVGPDVYTTLDSRTMPHVLERLQDDSVGTKTGTPWAAYFRLRGIGWTPQAVGDLNSVKPPGFVGKTLSGLFIVQNRLGFFVEDRVIHSRNGDYFNFYPNSTARVQDDDPIDITIAVGKLANDEVLNIAHAVSFSEQLLFLSSRAQIVINTEAPLTPTNYPYALSTSVEADPDCIPTSANASAFIPWFDGMCTRVREYYVEGAGRVKRDYEITEAVPSLLSGKPLHIIACPSEGTLFVRTFNDTRIYVYRWYDANNSRVISSWGVWDFGDDRVVSLSVIDSTLYMLVLRAGRATLESIELAAWTQTTDTPVPIRLDRLTTIGSARTIRKKADLIRDPLSAPPANVGGT